MIQDPNDIALLGSTATSRITKYKGIVTAIQYNLSSATQVNVQQPVGKDGKISDAMCFDIHMCDYTAKLTAKKQYHPETTDINLGDEVEDIVTQFVGIVVAVIFGVNGCAEIFAVAPVDKELKSRVHLQNHKRFKVITPLKIAGPGEKKYGAVNHSVALKRGA